MPHGFASIAFTPTVRKLQEEAGSRASYARMEGAEGNANGVLGEAEASFLASRDSFYMGTVGETGWPYVQHRGGQPGFVRVLDESTIGFADLRGNRQYVSVGNLAGDDRVSLFFMDYPNRRRLKVFGHARIVGLDDRETLARLEPAGATGRVERGVVIRVAGFDWNCPQHITPRFTLDEVRGQVEPLQRRIVELEAALQRAS